MSGRAQARLGALVLGLVWALSQPAAAAPPPAPPVPVIIDTDVGDDIDDAFALAIAVTDPRLEVVGVTTAWGDTRKRVLLARRLLKALGRGDVPVAQGPPTPDSTPFTQSRWALAEPDVSPAPDAIAFIAAAAAKRPGQITLIALAPLSNVQALLDRRPDALRALRQVVMMGGSIHAGYEQGGAIPTPEPSAEYNVAQAPKAFTALLASRVPVTLFPLDSTQIKFDEVRRDRLFAHGSPASDALALLYHQWRLLNAWGQLTPTLFDVIPVAWMLQPSLCRPTPMRIVMDGQGFTLPVAGAPNADVCLSLDEDAAQRLIIEALAPEPAALR